MKFLNLFLLFVSSLAFANQTMVCVSWMGLKLKIEEAVVSEYATSSIQFDQGDWAYTADYMEGKFNYLTIFYKPLQISSTSRSLGYPLDKLSNAVDIQGHKATVDCDIR